MFKTLKQRSLHHDKTEHECMNESVALINLIKSFGKFIGSVSEMMKTTLGTTDDHNVKKLEDLKSLVKLNQLHETIVDKFKDRGRENFCIFMKDTLLTTPKY